MRTDQIHETANGFTETVSAAVTQLKRHLQNDYEQAYPELREIIHLVLDEEESKAWELTLFPHLLLPDLVEAHIANLNLRPAQAKHDDVFEPRGFFGVPAYQPALALCGA